MSYFARVSYRIDRDIHNLGLKEYLYRNQASPIVTDKSVELTRTEQSLIPDISPVPESFAGICCEDQSENKLPQTTQFVASQGWTKRGVRTVVWKNSSVRSRRIPPVCRITSFIWSMISDFSHAADFSSHLFSVFRFSAEYWRSPISTHSSPRPYYLLMLSSTHTWSDSLTWSWRRSLMAS